MAHMLPANIGLEQHACTVLPYTIGNMKMICSLASLNGMFESSWHWQTRLSLLSCIGCESLPNQVTRQEAP